LVAFLVVGFITGSAVIGGILGIGAAAYFVWATIAKLTRDEPVGTHWFEHFRWLILGTLLFVVGVIGLSTRGDDETRADRLAGAGIATVGSVLLIAGWRDLRLWIIQRDDPD
jgi:hypothetical protein